jgi:NDP-sugar pyrophosphorylase family protein
MKSARPKVLHHIAGRPMIEYTLATAATLEPQSTVVVVGHEAAAVQHALSGHVGLTFVVQEPQLGTGHALLTTEPVLAGKNGTVVLLSGDAPLLKASTIRTLVDRHRTANAAATVVTAVVEDSTGYGRIVRSGQNIARIVEERDASPTRTADPGDQFGHLRLRTGRVVRGRFAASARRTRSGSTTSRIWSKSSGGAVLRWKRSASRMPTKSGASTAAASWRQ